MEIVVENNVDTEIDLRAKRTGVKGVEDIVVDESFDKIKQIPGVSNQRKLTQQNFNVQKKVGQQRVRASAKKTAGKIFKKVGNGVETASTAFSFAQGGIDAAAGSDMIQRAEDLRKQRRISESEYDSMMRNGQLRVAQGSFGLANGVKSVVKFVGKRVQKSLLKSGSAAGVKFLMQAKRFGSVVGGVISMGTTATSLAKNAIAANDATKQGIVGKAAMYGVMAAVDAVTFVLDGVSVALDFVFPPLSPIIDLISTVLQVVNTILGFFADLIDFRTTKQRVCDEFKSYIESDAFKGYVNNMADRYRERGFDIFQYYVDAEVAGTEADTKTLRDASKTITKCLTDEAKKEFDNPNHRIALLDATSLGKKLEGRANGDEIVAGFGADEIYGKEGDDILFGRGGDDTIYGGPGNDYLNGGTGRDILLGGEGDDIIDCEPAVDKRCEGQEGEDTLELSGEALIFKEKLVNKPYIIMGKEWEGKPPTMSPVKGIYLDMGHSLGNGKQGRSGINLGSCFQGWPNGFQEVVHQPAFISSNDNLEHKFVDLFNKSKPVSLRNANELKHKTLWFLAEKDGMKYFCDGVSFYQVSESLTRVVRDAIKKIPDKYAVYRNGQLQYTHKKKLEALLTFAFKRSFVFDKFEKIAVARPANAGNVNNYIPTTIIGDNEDNVIDASYGLGDVVYTGEGNNVVSIGSTLTALTDNEFYKWAKYIVGGSGENTLVLQYMAHPENSCEASWHGRWYLVNVGNQQFDKERRKKISSYIAFLKGFKTVEIQPSRSLCQGYFHVNAENYDGASRFILDKTYWFVGPANKDVTVLPRNVLWGLPGLIKFGKGTASTLSMKYYMSKYRKIVTIDINQSETGYGKIRTYRNVLDLKNVMNVVSNPHCKNIIGSKQQNLLVAVGGQTTIDAKEGDDTLVSTRGRHTLIGGEGADTYVLHGPDVVDVLTISVIMGSDGKTIRCTTTIYGEWKETEKRLEIDVLQDDHADVVLTSVEIIPAEGDENTNLGTISKDSTNRKLIFEPGSNFNDLKRNKAKVVRIKYTTTGSMATIKEEDYGNLIRFESIKNFEDLKICIENDELVFKINEQIVLIDYQWKNKFKNEKSTNLFDLILDFAQRFPLILFRNSDKEFTRSTTKQTIKILYENLKYIESKLGLDYDSFIDSTSLSSDVGDEIDVGNGQNIVLAKTKGKTYKLGTQSSRSIIIANKFMEGSGTVVVEGGNGDHHTRTNILNAVVVGVGSGGALDIQLGRHDLIITGALPNEVRFSKCTNNDICAKDSKNRELIVRWTYWTCQRLIFKKSDDTRIIMNCQSYIEGKIKSWEPDFEVIVSYDSDKQHRLVLPFKKCEARITVSHWMQSRSIWIYFMDHGHTQIFEDKWRLPYLVIPADRYKPKEIDARMLVNAIKGQFKAGIKFTDKLVSNAGICQLVKDTLEKYNPPGYAAWKNLDHLKC